MTEEPYRWLEAIGNRREYIREQMRGGTPVFALSRPEGILLLGVGQGQSKVFEIYDRHAFAALGHPVDIEKLRQVAIEAAHLEGFNRSSKDVTLRRLISFALSTRRSSASTVSGVANSSPWRSSTTRGGCSGSRARWFNARRSPACAFTW